MINLMNKDDEVKEEIWVKAHKNSPFYEVSNLGRVRNSKTKWILKQFLDDEGYYKIRDCWKNCVISILSTVLFVWLVGRNGIIYLKICRRNFYDKKRWY